MLKYAARYRKMTKKTKYQLITVVVKTFVKNDSDYDNEFV